LATSFPWISRTRPNLIGQHGRSITGSFGITDRDLAPVEVQVFDPQAQAFLQA